MIVAWKTMVKVAMKCKEPTYIFFVRVRLEDLEAPFCLIYKFRKSQVSTNRFFVHCPIILIQYSQVD